MGNFIEYCNEIESARKQGFARVVLPAAICLPEICGSIEYPEIKGKNCKRERYKRWVVNHLKYYCPIEETLACIRCYNQDKSFVCREGCKIQDNAYKNGMNNLANRLYGLRNSLLHENNVQISSMLIDAAYSNAEFPIQHQPFIDGKLLYGVPIVDLGYLIFSLCKSAIRYYDMLDISQQNLLDSFDQKIFRSNSTDDVSKYIIKSHT